jgi:hypothetical protein
MQEHGSVTVNKAITAITSLPDSGTTSTRYVNSVVWNIRIECFGLPCMF